MKTFRTMVIEFGFVTCTFLAAASAPAEPPSPRSLLVNIAVRPDQVQEITSLGLDVWSVLPDRRTLEARVSSAELRDLRARGYGPVVVDPDLYETWRRIREDRARRGGPRGDWDEYHNLESTNAMLEGLHAAYPEITALFVIGTSVEGRPINGIRISDDAANVDPTESAIFIVGCHHAREWISVEVSLYLAQRLLADYNVDPDVRKHVDHGEIWIVPVLNVDGYLYTETTNRWWRKNRRDNGDGTFGIDLNRNYSYEWGHNNGSSGNPGSELYRGPFAFSEPECQAVRDVFDEREFLAGLTYHSYSQYVMSPWGYTTDPPPDAGAMEALVAQMAAIINRQHTNPLYDYVSGRWGVLLYIGSGIFVDWVYGVHDAPGVIVELRPRPGGPGGFHLPEEQILETCIENYAGALYMIDQTFSLPLGDMNGSRTVDLEDIGPFALALVDREAYEELYPNIDPEEVGDVNQDGSFNGADVQPFADLIVNP